MTDVRPTRTVDDNWDEETDVVVVGCGFAGGAAAIAAHDTGAEVLIVEKMAHPGGISICSAGGVRVSDDPDAAFAYLAETNAGTTPDLVLRTFAQGMAEIDGFIEELAAVNGAKVARRTSPGNYPFPGRNSFAFVMIEDVPGFDHETAYPHIQVPGGGARLFKVVEDNLAKRGIEVRTRCPAHRLVAGPDRAVLGIVVEQDGKRRRIRARRGVVLACGGFEANLEMQQQYWQGKPVMPTAFRGNTGDGIRMAQDLGADLWHMWHYHGTYGFRHPDEAYPFGIRTKRLPDWFPVGEGEDTVSWEAGFADDRAVKMPWVLLDRDGRRFMNEYEPYMQDTGHRPMQRFRPETQDFPALPGWLVYDEEGRKTFPIGQPIYNEDGIAMQWSRDNLAEVQLGILGTAATLAELAEALSVDPARLRETLDRYNASCTAGDDDDFSRPPSSMMPVATPPFYYATAWPMVSNTQGGPVHDERQRVIDVYGDAIPGLYAAGELGSLFGHLYLSGGNLSECFVCGRAAGREAAARAL
jgi:succinate dehydrogenase/fumarate reductase flavoprotein subunit